MKSKNKILQIVLPDDMDNKDCDYEVIVLKMESVVKDTPKEEDPFDWDPEDEAEKKAFSMMGLKNLEDLDNEDYSKW
jgi:hypothetical protein